MSHKVRSRRQHTTAIRLAMIAGVILVVAAVSVWKRQAPAATPPPAAGPILPETQLENWLAEGRPVLAFFHSNTCTKCVQMTEIVARVYPEFSDRVALLDVDVYDQNNQRLVGRAGIQVIPTLLFIDRQSQTTGYSGVMDDQALFDQLTRLAQE